MTKRATTLAVRHGSEEAPPAHASKQGLKHFMPARRVSGLPGLLDYPPHERTAQTGQGIEALRDEMRGPVGVCEVGLRDGHGFHGDCREWRLNRLSRAGLCPCMFFGAVGAGRGHERCLGMKTVTVMTAYLEPEDIEEVEIEAKSVGVPPEYYFVEGWRRAFFEALRERDVRKRELEVEHVEAWHKRNEGNARDFDKVIARNLERRHSRSNVRDVWGNHSRRRKTP